MFLTYVVVLGIVMPIFSLLLTVLFGINISPRSQKYVQIVFVLC